MREGKTVVITDRGQVIAHLTPPPPAPENSTERILAELERQGKIVRPQLTREELLKELDALGPARGAMPSGTMQRILDEDREERF